MSKYLAALDQGTTSSRAVIFTETGELISSFNKEFPQHYPKPGWVEHDPNDILDTQIAALQEAVRLSGAKTASLKLEAEVIASPAVYNNIMVIGTTGKGTSFIYGIEIRTLASAEDGEPEAVEAEPEEATKEMQEEPEGEAEPEEEAGAEEPAEDA